MNSLYVVIPAYNEQDNIEEVILSWYPVLAGKADTSRLVVADSGSTDNTHAILLELQKKYPQLVILSDTGKQHGPKLLALYRYAIEQGADYVFQTDSDGQTNPKEFPRFWELRKNYDAILGHRTSRGDGKARAFVEHVVCFLLFLFFGVRVPDANAPFRLMKCDVVRKYIDKFSADYNIPNIMFTAYFSHYKEKLIFRKISFQARQKGTNSIDIPKIVKIGWNALKDFYYFKRDMR